MVQRNEKKGKLICLVTNINRKTLIFSEMRQECSQKCLFVGSAWLPPHDLAVFENGKCRYSLNLVFGSQQLIFIHIYFQHACFALHFFAHLLYDGRHGFARTAPGSVKVYQNGFPGINYIVECFHESMI